MRGKHGTRRGLPGTKGSRVVCDERDSTSLPKRKKRNKKQKQDSK